MTPSSPQPPEPPAPPAADTGPGGGAPATAVTGTAPPTAAERPPAPSEPEADTGTRTVRQAAAAVSGTAQTGTGQNAAARSGTDEPATEAATETETGAEPRADTGAGRGTGRGPRSEAASSAAAGAPSGAETETEPDPGAAGVVKSRLPALVRAATSTAIGRPTQRTGPVGRPGRAALAGAAVAGALLVSVPFLVLGDRDHKDGKGPETAGTVLGGSGQEAPGDFALSPPGDGPSGSAEPEEPVREDSAPASAGNGSGKADTGSEPGKGESTSTPPGAAEQDGSAGTKAQPARQSAGKSSDATADKPPASRPALTLSAPVSLRSHLSGRCIDVPGADFGDGKKLYVWDCNNSTAQRWQFASDGTVRIAGLCLDVAGANFGDGTPIQIARCNGNAAQQFTLNPSHDLVNTVVGKCVDIRNNNPGNGAWLQLWSCAGSANQKWSA